MDRHIICSILWCVAATVFHQGEAAQTKQRNIVFVLADDYGFNDIGYHSKDIKTPVLDEISSKGVRLENYYVQPICTPSRSQFMSGRYQIHTGLQHDIIWATQANALPRDSPTLADKMKEAGYATHCVGKWHLGFYKREYLPINRGFDTFYGYYTGSEDFFNHTRGWLNRVQYLDLHDQDKPVFTETGNYSAHIFTKKAIERIQNHNKSQPMFLYLAYQSVHSPLEVPEKYIKPYQHIKNHDRRVYAGMVAALDEGVGNVTKALMEADMWENTVFVFSTDNGGQILSGGNNFPLRGWKLSLWEGGLRGVGFVHAPNMTTAGTVNKGLMHISDWYPTFVGLAGGSLNDTKPLDGYDQWKTISEGHPSPREVLLHNIDILKPKKGGRLFNHTFDTRVRAAIRKGDWKLITGDPSNGSWVPVPDSDLFFTSEKQDPPSKNLWLFNITADPTEHNEVSQQYPEVVQELLDLLVQFNNTAVPPRYPPNDPKSNPALHGGVWGPWD